jgi:hypothetical protein
LFVSGTDLAITSGPSSMRLERAGALWVVHLGHHDGERIATPMIVERQAGAGVWSVVPSSPFWGERCAR